MSLDVNAVRQDPAASYLLDEFLKYAGDAIQDQAIPHFYDGLLPTQRKHLLSLQDLGATSSSRFKKSSQVTANTQGHYRPVGMTYNVLVNMSQDFKVPQMLTDPEGLWGEPETGQAAAERYTEIRLSPLGEEALFKHLPNKRLSATSTPHGIVPLTLNYTMERLEEVYLPARLPMLLLNGGTGIAVGLAQTFQPLAFKPLIQYIIDKAKNLNPPLSTLKLGYPSNPLILSTQEELSEALNTGRGSIKVAGRYTVEYNQQKRPAAIIVHSVPNGKTYNKIGDALTEWRTRPNSNCPFSSFENRSEPNQTHLRFNIKRPSEFPTEAHIEQAIQLLYKECGIADYESINMVALKNRFPIQYTLPNLVDDWIEERVNVEQRVAKKDHARYAAELSRLTLLSLMQSHIEQVATALRTSTSNEELRNNLNRILSVNLSDDDFDYVSGITVRALTRFNMDAAQRRIDTLNTEILPHLTSVVENTEVAKEDVIKDLQWFLDNAQKLGIRDIQNSFDANLAAILQTKQSTPRTPIAQGTPQARRTPWDPYKVKNSTSRVVLITGKNGLISKVANKDLPFDPKKVTATFEIVHATIAPDVGSVPVFNVNTKRIEHIQAEKVESQKLSSGTILKLKPADYYVPIQDLSEGNPTHVLFFTATKYKLVALPLITNPQATITLPMNPTRAYLVNKDSTLQYMDKVLGRRALTPEFIKAGDLSAKATREMPTFQSPDMQNLFLKDHRSYPSIDLNGHVARHTIDS